LEGSFIVNPVVYGLDDNGILLRIFYHTDILEKNDWIKFIGILRGIGEITHFKIGLFMFAFSAGCICYVDEFKLIPLRSIVSHNLIEEFSPPEITSDTQYYAKIFAFGNCRLRSSLKVDNVSGTDPTLDTSIDVFYNFSGSLYKVVKHSTFTDTGMEEICDNIGDACKLRVNYKVGGTDPSFTVLHRLALEPLGEVVEKAGGAL